MQRFWPPNVLTHPCLKGLEQSDYERLEVSFGKNFRNRIQNGAIQMKKTKTGGYCVASDKVLVECLKLLPQANKITNNNNAKYSKPSVVTEPKKSDEMDRFVAKHIDDSDDDFLIISDEEYSDEQMMPKKLPPDVELELKDFVDKCEPAKLTYVEFPKKHLLNDSTRTNELLKQILDRSYHVAQPCHQALAPIMEKFSANHRKFKYYEMIQNLTANAEHKFQVEIPSNELTNFFSIITGLVTPRELFGSKSNVRKIKIGCFEHMKNIDRRFFEADKIVSELDLGDIKWLKVIHNLDEKILIMSNIVRWFVKKYIMIIVHTYFYSSSSEHKGERIFVPVKQWIVLRNNFIDELKHNQVFKMGQYRVSDNVAAALLKFYIKNDGLRTIYQAMSSEKQKNEVIMIKQLLKQAYSAQSKAFHASELDKYWNPIAIDAKRNGRRMYFVTADISDAYGSINQDKVLEIANKLLDNHPHQLVYQDFSTLNSNILYITNQKQFYHQSLPLLFSTGMISAPNSALKNSTRKISELKERLRCYVKNQTVLNGDEIYTLNGGVGQGLPLASVLADIYYGTMEIEEFKEFRREGSLIRYVDDFLYVTEDKKSAEKFLAKVKEGIASYNCTFKPAKTHTNLPPQSENTFRFLGYRFDINTFEVEPEYSSPPSQYNMAVDILPAKEEAKGFETRMMHTNSLKLTQLVLNMEINSITQVKKTMLAAAKSSAHKCDILIQHMLGVDYFKPEMVCRVIGRVIDKFVKIVQSHCTAGRKRLVFPKKQLYMVFVAQFRRHAKLRDTLLVPILKQKMKEDRIIQRLKRKNKAR